MSGKKTEAATNDTSVVREELQNIVRGVKKDRRGDCLCIADHLRQTLRIDEQGRVERPGDTFSVGKLP